MNCVVIPIRPSAVGHVSCTWLKALSNFFQVIAGNCRNDLIVAGEEKTYRVLVFFQLPAGKRLGNTVIRCVIHSPKPGFQLEKGVFLKKWEEK